MPVGDPIRSRAAGALPASLAAQSADRARNHPFIYAK